MSITIALAISHPRRTWRYALCAAAFVLASTPCVAFTCAAEPVTTTASTEQDEDAEPPAGLRAVYTDGAGRKIVRVDPAVRFHWQESPADPRLVAGKFTAHWSGKLLAIAPGQHRFHLFAAGGTVRLSIGGKSLIDQTAGAPQWIDSPPVDLEYGHHPLEIEFHRTAEDAAVDLYWSGPRFQVEHVPERALSHDPQLPIDLRFEQGRQLVHGLRCAACHAIHDAQPVPSAPSLAKLSGNVSRAWLMDWIGGRKESPHEPNPSNDIKNAASATDNAVLPQAPPAIDDVKFRMPGLGLSREDARHIVAYLLEESDSSATKLKPVPTNAVTTPQAETTSDAKAGDELFHSVGCLACHSVGPLGSRRLSGGGDLAAVGDKRPADFFARWLSAPQQIDARHRMPVFPLTDEERANLAGYLQTLRSVPAIEHAPPDAADFGGVRERGQKLVATHHCAACHEMPAAQPAASVSQLRPTRLQAQDNCLGEPNPRLARPGYRLRPDQRTAVIEYLGQILPSAESRAADDRPLRTAPPPRDGARLFADLNCLGCHSRGLAPGIAAQSADLVAAHPELAGALAALAPPALTDVGDKLERAALLEAMTTSASPRRPWLSIRMPRFQFAPGEAEALADWLITADRIPQRAAPPEATLAENALLTAGSRLVTSDGFGCASCHAIGKWSPKQDNLAARGTDLSLVGQRIRRSWFDRWVHNPARIVPRMEMPSIEIPVAGVLDERLDDQITAVWNVLNRPGFTPPAGGAIRVVRRRNLPEEVEQAALLTDVLRIDGRSMIRPLAIGLSNRHNILFDLEQNRFTGWWLGDVARERTEGKRWFWEPGGTHLLPTPKQGGASDIVIERGEQRVEPLVVGQCAAQLDAWRHVPGGIAFEMRLSFPGLDNSAAKNLHIQQTFLSLPVDTAGQSGFRRRIEIHQAPEQANIILRLFPEIFSGTIDGNQFSTSAGPAGRLTASVTTPGNAQLVDAERGGTVRLSGSAGQAIVCEVEYTSALAADRYPGPVVASASRPAAQLHSIPGFDAVRLPLPVTEMPTGFAWRAEGTLLLSSLKGEVFAAVDTDQDHLPDALRPLSDDLAAPYGLYAHDDVIDVINKNGLLRLSDFDHQGRAQRTEVVADGWGHTDDYHDWAVGPVPDDARGYYIALPCRQNARDEAESRWRGWALHLAPREPTTDNPRHYTIEPFCSGLRFPMGLARNRAGDLFATDNQGNYNPFNELNQLVAGAHYGFLNKFEAKQMSPPPRRDPAIDIPHPWTRSVNGVCFLQVPTGGQASTPQFGPWEGHLVGCEYDTRRLVRMSLEQVNGQYQGAVYPLSDEPAEGEEALEGPVVCQVGPDGALYVGNMRDSGWGAGQNTGSIVRLRYNNRPPAGIAEVRAAADGFLIEFAQPVLRDAAADPANYSIESFRRISTADYGGPDVDRQQESVRAVTVDDDGRTARLQLSRLRPGYVYEIHVKHLSGDDRSFFPAEAYYTLRSVPKLSLRETGS